LLVGVLLLKSGNVVHTLVAVSRAYYEMVKYDSGVRQQMAVWLSGNALVSINVVTLLQAG